MTPTRIYFSVKPSLCKLNKLVVLPFRVTATTETFRLHNTTKSLRSFTRWSKYSLVDWVIISSHFIMRVISSGVCVFIVVVFCFCFLKVVLAQIAMFRLSVPGCRDAPAQLSGPSDHLPVRGLQQRRRQRRWRGGDGEGVELSASLSLSRL